MTTNETTPPPTDEVLPRPEWIESWPIKDRTSATARLPYAYRPDPENKMKALPIWEMIYWVEKAFDYLDKNHSLRETSEWLGSKTGKVISHQGLNNLWKARRFKDVANPRRKILKKRKKANSPRTPEEKREHNLRLKKAGARRSVTCAKKRLEKLLDPEGPNSDLNGLGGTIPAHDFDAIPQDQEIIFRPNPGPQTEFLAAPEQEVLFGGAAGGGKSYALLADPMRYFDNKNFNGLVLRRTNDELRELIWKSQEMYPRAFPGAKWAEKKSQWTFPSGGRLWMTYLERDEDVLRYQGQAFCVAVGTPVLMADGSYRPIEDLSVGDMVQTLEGPQPVLWRSDRLRKPLAKVTVYDSEGRQLCEQLQPDTHPIALLSSEPYSQLSDLSRNIEQFHKHPIQWISQKHLESRVEGSRETSASEEDDQSRSKAYEDGHQEMQQPRGCFYPAVLASQRPQSAPCRDATQCHTSCKSWSQWREKLAETSGFSSDLQQPPGPVRSQTGHSRQPCDPSYDGGSGVQPWMQTPQDFQGGCQPYRGLCDEPLLGGQEDDSDCVLLLDDVVEQDHDGLLGDGTGCTPSRSRYRQSRYSHPYTGELRDLKVPVELGIVHVEPYSLSEKEVIDVTIGVVNHYITFGGVINRNCYIAFDELTQHPTPFVWNYMRSRLRTTDPDLPVFMRATTNPGGPGHSWVKKMFIDPAPVGEPFAATDLDTGEALRYPPGHEKEGKPLFHRRFIPARLSDNPYLAKEGMYEANLLSLPEMQRRQLLEGDWTIAEGAAFPEFRVSTHVTDPYEIPGDWRRFRSCDFGYSSYSAVHWFAIDPAFETLVCYRELYVSKLTARDLAKEILRLERGEGIQYGILDSSCWHTRGQSGPSIAEEMIAEGCKWRPSDRTAGARVAGRNRLHELLKINDESSKPGIVFFNHCRQIIADLQVIPNDPKGSDDIDPRYASDHAYDSIRYAVMSRPRSKSPFDFGNRTVPSWQPSDPILGY
jgi:hypothetical protein